MDMHFINRKGSSLYVIIGDHDVIFVGLPFASKIADPLHFLACGMFYQGLNFISFESPSPREPPLTRDRVSLADLRVDRVTQRQI